MGEKSTRQMARVAIFSILERTKLLMPPGALGEWVG